MKKVKEVPNPFSLYGNNKKKLKEATTDIKRAVDLLFEDPTERQAEDLKCVLQELSEIGADDTASQEAVAVYINERCNKINKLANTVLFC